MESVTLEEQIAIQLPRILKENKNDIIELYVDDRLRAIEGFLDTLRYNSNDMHLDIVEDIKAIVEEHAVDYIRNDLEYEFNNIIERNYE